MRVAARDWTWIFVAATLAAGAPAAAQDAGANDPEAAELVATQIRQQGFPCDEPKTANRDEGASSPDEAVWIIGCKNATYRVRLIPDMAAQIEQI